MDPLKGPPGRSPIKSLDIVKIWPTGWLEELGGRSPEGLLFSSAGALAAVHRVSGLGFGA